MPDVILKEICLKMGWISKLLYIDGTWKDHVLHSLPFKEVKVLLICNMKFSDFQKHSNINTWSMWFDVFKYWCEFNCKDSGFFITKESILN